MLHKLVMILSAVAVFSGNVMAQKAVICLTYDDGLPSHLVTVIPQLDSFQLKGTFFLNAIRGSSDKIGQAPEALISWRQAAAHGHELGNHTMFHPCPEALGWDKTVSIETYTIEQIITEITTINAMLGMIDPKRKHRSFAFPCNNTIVQGKDYSATIREKGLVQYGRGGGDSNAFVKDIREMNSMQVPSWLVEKGTTIKQLIAFAEKVRSQGTMGVYQFHGVGAEFFTISPETHRAFLKYLSDNHSLYQVMTFSEAMEIRSKR
ncbi:polysaccharide deacetylase family protein [Paraflavitalea pollutisoli]|uniref:polysaccharide deacetylase family protein n=1 Tax=Paraflavitalea pollutisoli TaxID=3034143 RepID=UPI0023EB96D2|nr:polysaccharide deacetylase family protein [Paraflavitalea sp. H1-2-19X]